MLSCLFMPSARPIRHCIPLPRANTAHLSLDCGPLKPPPTLFSFNFCFKISLHVNRLSVRSPWALPHPKDEIQSLSGQSLETPILSRLSWFLYLTILTSAHSWALLVASPVALPSAWNSCSSWTALHKYHFLREVPSDRTPWLHSSPVFCVTSGKENNLQPGFLFAALPYLVTPLSVKTKSPRESLVNLSNNSQREAGLQDVWSDTCVVLFLCPSPLSY